METQFNNSDLALLCVNFEKRVVARFIENYVLGNKECTPIEEISGENEQIFIVDDKTEGEPYTVRNWKCDCREMGRTGVACCHIIMLATLNKERSCLDLISGRWRKEQLL